MACRCLDAVPPGTFKLAEHLAGLKQRFGWVPSRIGDGEPPEQEAEAWNGLAEDCR